MARYNELPVEEVKICGARVELVKVWASTEPEEDAYFVVYLEENQLKIFEEAYETEEEARIVFDEIVSKL